MDKICGDSPIFIGCMPRSGSSLLRVMLDSHPGLAADAEINWVGGKRPFRKLTNSYAKVALGGKRYVNKEPKIITPKGLRRLCALGYENDELYLIVIKRRAYDILVSYIKSRNYPLFNGMNMASIFVNDSSGFILGYKALDAMKSLNMLEMKYESLVEEPVSTMRGVCNFIGVPVSQSMFRHSEKPHVMIEHYSDRQAAKPLFKSSVGQYKKFFKESGFKPNAKLRRICRGLDEMLGYEEDDD